MKFGTESTTELTQKIQGQSTKMTYIHLNIYIIWCMVFNIYIYINTQISPILNFLPLYSGLLASLTHPILYNNIT